MVGILGGGFNLFKYSPLFGDDFHLDSYFFNWVETTNQKWMVGILFSYWGGLFAGAMVVSGISNPLLKARFFYPGNGRPFLMVFITIYHHGHFIIP